MRVNECVCMRVRAASFAHLRLPRSTTADGSPHPCALGETLPTAIGNTHNRSHLDPEQRAVARPNSRSHDPGPFAVPNDVSALTHPYITAI